MDVERGSDALRYLLHSPSASWNRSQRSISTVGDPPSPYFSDSPSSYQKLGNHADIEKSASSIELTSSRSDSDYESHNFQVERPSTKEPDIETRPVPSSEDRQKNFVRIGRQHWFSISILVLAFYSTAMSGLWLAVATYRPIWGHRISSHNGVTSANASLACALLAKSIELSFVTAFVAFLGQQLSRRAFYKPQRGVNLAEMSMRTWVMQPGSMITNWESVWYAAPSWLGMVTFFVAWFVMLYTSASDALVSPKLLLGPINPRVLYGNVSTSFSNLQYIEGQCKTPITAQMDPNNSGLTCGAIEQAGQGFHNIVQYLSDWSNASAQQVITSELRDRPRIPAMLYDNTTVKGSWINTQDIPGISENDGRTINNVTLAFPHAGVVAVAQAPRNRIMQPADLGGQGDYHINASVPSPALNVLCAAMTMEELKPIVYRMWPFTNSSLLNSVDWVEDVPPFPDWLNSTSVDEIFGFGKKYNRRPPIFPKLPEPFNTLLNHTGGAAEYADSVYLLATTADSSYTMCALRASLTTQCSTHYHASASGAQLESHCEDPSDNSAYFRSEPSAEDGILQPSWSRIAEQWAFSISLNSGFSDDYASITRLLTQLIPQDPSFSLSKPSIAEALAALAGSTLLLSTLDAPFVPSWNYTALNLTQPVQQGLNATIRTYEYQSSYAQPWQQAFFVVLYGTFVVSCCCLYHLLRHAGLLLDFTEPLSLFLLAMNSPQSSDAGKRCGIPDKEQYRKKWSLKVDRTHGPLFETATP